MSHENCERRLQKRIKQLERENSDLKKNAEMENVLLIAMGLLLKKTQYAPSKT